MNQGCARRPKRLRTRIPEMNRQPPDSSIDLRAFVLYDRYQSKTVEESYENYEKLCKAMEKGAVSYNDYEYWFNQYFVDERRNQDLMTIYSLTKDKRALQETDISDNPNVIKQRTAKKSFNYFCKVFQTRNIDKEDRDDNNSFSIQSAYEKYAELCEESGEWEVPYEKYDNWFRKHVEKRVKVLPIPDIRGCILSDVIDEKSAEKSIDDLCKAFKYHKIDKEDHDYWYKRFENGHAFTRISFSNLPNEIITEIVENCDLKSFLRLRKVSLNFRCVVDRSKPAIKDIQILSDINYFNVELDSVRSEIHVFPVFNGIRLRGNMEKSFHYLKMALNNPKLKLKTLQLELEDKRMKKFDDRLLNLFTSLNHKIHVKNFTILTRNVDYVIDVVKCLKPGVLKRLSLHDSISMNIRLIDIDKLVEMEQWKKAKHAKVWNTNTPIEHFFHFTTFDVRIQTISIEDLTKLVNAASQSIKFKRCEISVQEELDKEPIKEALNLQETDSFDTYSIPDLGLVIKFSSSGSSLEVKKS